MCRSSSDQGREQNVMPEHRKRKNEIENDRHAEYESRPRSRSRFWIPAEHVGLTLTPTAEKQDEHIITSLKCL